MEKNMALSKAQDTQDASERMYGNLSSSEKNVSYTLKTTKTGIPLVPQPSDDPDDPLVSPSAPFQVLAPVADSDTQNWSTLKKHAALIVLAMESLMVKFSATLIVSALSVRGCHSRC